MQAESDYLRNHAVQIGDIVTLSLRKEIAQDKKEEDGKEQKPLCLELFLIAEGQADEEVYLEPLTENTQVARSLFCIEKAKPTPAEETSKGLRRDDARNAPKAQEEEEDKGKPVAYGGQVSLRHVHSQKLLAFKSKPTWQVKLADFSFQSKYILTVQSADIHSSVGDIVKYQDTFSLVFEEESVSQFFTIKTGGLESVHLLGTSIAQTCNCVFHPYEIFEPIPTCGLKYGSIITISSKKLKMFMTGVKEKDASGKTVLITELQSVSTLKAVDYYGEWKAQLTHSKETDSLWIIEHLNKYIGGVISKGDRFHLKHASSEQYLGRDFQLYPSAPTDFFFSTPGAKRSEQSQADKKPAGKKTDQTQPIRTPDTVILLTSDDLGFQAEPQDTLEHQWQNMISSSQQSEKERISQAAFGVNLKAVKQVSEAEENLFEMAEAKGVDVEFYKSVLGFRSKIAEARSYLEGYSKLQTIQMYTRSRLNEYMKNFVFPNVTCALGTIVKTLKGAKTAESLEKLQGILVSLKLHKEILSILAYLIMHRMDKIEEKKASEEGAEQKKEKNWVELLLIECQNAMHVICVNNRHSCATVLGDSYTNMITILTNSPERFHELLSTILDVMELEHEIHKFFVEGMIDVMAKSMAVSGIRKISSILKTLERMCKGTGRRFDGYREFVFEDLEKKGLFSSLMIFEHEPDLFVTCIIDREEPHYFSLQSDDLEDAGLFEYVMDYLSLITIKCDIEGINCPIEKYIGLSFQDLIKLANSPKVKFHLRSQLLCMLKGMSSGRTSAQAEHEQELEKNCWLYNYEAESSYEDLAFTLFQDPSQVSGTAQYRAEVLKRLELEFWVSETIPPAVVSDVAKGSNYFLNYTMAHLQVLERLLEAGHIQKYYLACIFQALSDALVGLVGVDAAGSDMLPSTHWTAPIFNSIRIRMQMEGQRFQLQSTYNLFISLLCKCINKSKLRKVDEILQVCVNTDQSERTKITREIIERRWVTVDIMRYIELNFDIERLLGDDKLPERSSRYVRKLKDMCVDFVGLLVEMMASKSPFLEDNNFMLKLVKAQTNQNSGVIDALNTLEPMTKDMYGQLSGSVKELMELAGSKSVLDEKTQICELLGGLCRIMSSTLEQRPDTFSRLQVILRKLDIGQVMKTYWRICYENRTSTDKEVRQIISRMAALSKFFVLNNPKNIKQFLRSMDWRQYFGEYSEFHNLMRAVGFASFLGPETMLHLIKSTIYQPDKELSSQILKFVVVWLEKDENRGELEFLIANVVRQIIDDMLTSPAPLAAEVAENIILVLMSVWSEQNAGIFYQTKQDVSARVSNSDESFSSLHELLEGNFASANKTKMIRLGSLVSFDSDEDSLTMQRLLSDESNPKAKFLPQLRITLKFISISASFHDKMRDAILSKFKRGIEAAQNPKNPKAKQFKAFIRACCDSFLQGPHTTFVFDLLHSFLEEVLDLPPNATEAQMAVPDRVKANFWDFGVIEQAYNAVVHNPNPAIKSSALRLMNAFVENDNYENRELMVVFLRETDRFYHFFWKSVELMNSFKGYYATMQKHRKRSQGLAFTSLPKAPAAAAKDDVSQSVEALTLFLQFYRAMSDVCFTSFQNLLRFQESYSGLTINMISQLTTFLSEASTLFGNTNNSVLDTAADVAAIPVLTETIEALAESVSGPNIENQVIVGANSRTYVALHKLMGIVQGNQDELSQGLHVACLNLFKALLETNDVPPAYFKDVMWKVLNAPSDMQLKHPRWETLYQGMKNIYEVCVGLPENEKLAISGAPESLAKEDTLKLGILQCILLVRLEKIAKDKGLSEALQGEEPCINFYLRFIGYVEIAKQGTDPDHPLIFELYFPIPFEAKFLTLMTEGLLIENARRTSQQDKIDSFTSKLGSCTREMLHQQYLSRFPRLKSMTQNWEMCSTLSFLLVVLINTMLLFFTKGYEEGTLVMSLFPSFIVFYLALMQVILKGLAATGFLIEYWPHLETIFRKKVEINITDYYRMSDKDSQYISTRYSSLLSSGGDGAENLGGMMQASFYIYNYCYFIFTITAIFNYKLYPILLIDIVYQFSSLMTILKAITLNAKTLLLTGFFAIVVIFIFTTLSFIFFAEYYSADSNMFCTDLLHCFISTLSNGIRSGGGIGDVLTQASPSDYWFRMIFDMFFYIVIIVVMLNIVFGIIIDTFGDLRDRKREAEEDINNVCFICGQDRNIIDLRGEGWMQHFMSIHSPFAYLSFLVYLSKLDVADCSGLEKYVKEMVASKDTGYFPPTSKMIGSQAE